MTTARPLCRFFFLQHHCRFGETCAYSHEIPDGMTRQEALKLIPCPYYASGSCRYGDHCSLQHERLSSESNETTSSDQDGVCGICLEDVSQTRFAKYGLLSCCQHTFCFKCLMEWRTEGSDEAEDRRTCPTCREKSDYVIPSNIKPIDKEDKERIVHEYRTRLGRVPCKKFDGILGSCPYGSDCFYAHLDEEGDDCKADDCSMKELYETRQKQRRNRRRRGDSVESELEHFSQLLMMMQMQGLLGDSDEEDSDDELDYISDILLGAMGRHFS